MTQFVHDAAIDDAALTAFLMTCEEADFLWDAHREERWLGQLESLDPHDGDHDRIAIWGELAGIWFTAIVLIDGNGAVEDLLRREDFDSRTAAIEAYRRLH